MFSRSSRGRSENVLGGRPETTSQEHLGVRLGRPQYFILRRFEEVRSGGPQEVSWGLPQDVSWGRPRDG